MTTTTGVAIIAPVCKSILVAASQQHAFDVFTAGLDRWWPRKASIGTSPMKRVSIEPQLGGRGSSSNTATSSGWGPRQAPRCATTSSEAGPECSNASKRRRREAFQPLDRALADRGTVHVVATACDGHAAGFHADCPHIATCGSRCRRSFPKRNASPACPAPAGRATLFA
jgi:hypothetical protein